MSIPPHAPLTSELIANIRDAVPMLENYRVHDLNDPAFLAEIEGLLRDAAAALQASSSSVAPSEKLFNSDIADLIMLMPDAQVDEIFEMVRVLREARAMASSLPLGSLEAPPPQKNEGPCPHCGLLRPLHRDDCEYERFKPVPAASPEAPQPTSEQRPRVWWEYIGEELAVFWESPYGHGQEKIATFWWPAHPVEATADVESAFEEIARNACVASLGASRSSEQGWRSMESAPKDGTKVLLCWFDGIAAPMFNVGCNLGEGRRWQNTHDWLHNEASWPTHWMPLPDPPSEHGKE